MHSQWLQCAELEASERVNNNKRQVRVRRGDHSCWHSDSPALVPMTCVFNQPLRAMSSTSWLPHQHECALDKAGLTYLDKDGKSQEIVIDFQTAYCMVYTNDPLDSA